jgi:hypothetical protein
MIVVCSFATELIQETSQSMAAVPEWPLSCSQCLLLSRVHYSALHLRVDNELSIVQLVTKASTSPDRW